VLLLFVTKWLNSHWRYVIRQKKGYLNEQMLGGIWNFILSLTSHDRQQPVSSKVQSPATLWERRNRSRLTTIRKRVSDSSSIRDILQTNTFLFFTYGITIQTIQKKRLKVRLRNCVSYADVATSAYETHLYHPNTEAFKGINSTSKKFRI